MSNHERPNGPSEAPGTILAGGIVLVGGAFAFLGVFSYLAARFHHPEILEGNRRTCSRLSWRPGPRVEVRGRSTVFCRSWSLAVIGCAAGIVAGWQYSDATILVAAVVFGLVVPFTLVVIAPTKLTHYR